MVCDDPAREAAVDGALHANGYEVAGRARRAIDALELTSVLHPEVVVLDLALTGVFGLRIVPMLRLCADTEVVVFSPFGSLEAPARQAGAYAVLDPDDIAGLAAALRTIAARGQDPVPGDALSRDGP